MTDQLVKILFECDPDSLNGGNPELLWAKYLTEGHSVQLFEIQNSPFYARGISYLDVITAASDPKHDGILSYKGTYSLSHHSTYRLIVDKTQFDFESWWRKLGIRFRIFCINTTQRKLLMRIILELTLKVLGKNFSFSHSAVLVYRKRQSVRVVLLLPVPSFQPRAAGLFSASPPCHSALPRNPKKNKLSAMNLSARMPRQSYYASEFAAIICRFLAISADIGKARA